MSIEHAQQYLQEQAENFELLETREEQLITLRELGEELEPMPAEMKCDANLVPGCASATWVELAMGDDHSVTFYADSQSFISKGYLLILTKALNNCQAEEILTDVEPHVQAFAERAGVRLSMIASRANVFERVFRFMQKKVVEALAQTT